jgi:8-oxo-dGTP pyrophosphatase MutT (NUDIX family)
MPMSEYMRAVRAGLGNRLIEVPAACVIVRDAAGRVLLARHSEGDVWVPPGGAIEPLETPADAAVREVWEETGLHVALTRILGVFGGPEFVVRYANGDRTSYLMVVFEGRVEGGTERPDGDEILELRWFAREHLDALALSAWMHEVLDEALSGRADAGFRPAGWTPPASGDREPPRE